MRNYTKASKFLSLVLRHKPEKIGIQLDRRSWAKVPEILMGVNLTMEDLEYIVETDEKQRYSFNDDKTLIRANQGHSIPIDLELEAVEPPETLYHGTIGQFLGSIKKEGLQRRSRQFVHLSKDVETALAVGRRRGKPVVLQIASGRMFEDGYEFFLSENGVWLTKEAPSSYIKFPGESAGKKE